jgi:SAM-dependent methyltransferase
MDLATLKLTPEAPILPVIRPVSEWESISIQMDTSTVDLGGPVDAYVARDVYPLPQTADREGYHDDRHGDYWFSGLKDYALTVGACRRLGLSISNSSNVFELGCASGRVLRHFAIQSGCRCKGADINANHVEWVNRHLPENASAIDTTFHPPLPLPDNAFDLSCAFSVFTHVEHFETAWLEELARITRPTGLVFATIHSEHTWRRIKTTYLYQALNAMKDRIRHVKISDALFEQPLPSPRFVIRMETGFQVYNTNVFHHTDYIKSVWGRFMDVLEIVPGGHEYQDVVIMRPRQV